MTVTVTATTPGGTAIAAFEVTAVGGWDQAINQAQASGSWAPITAWYEANTGHESLGIAVDDLEPGSLASTHDGQIIQGVTGSTIRVAHNNVTIRGCRVVNGATYGAYLNPTFGANVTGLVIEHCTLVRSAVDPANDGSNAAYLHPAPRTPFGQFDVTVRHCNAYGWSGGLRGMGRVNFEYNWFHDGQHPDGVHMNCIRPGAQGGRAYRNFLTEGRSGACSIYFDKELTTDVEMRENILAGLSPLASPSYLINLKSGAYSAPARNIRIVDNMFGPNVYGAGSDAGIRWGDDGNVRAGNRYLLDSVSNGRLIPADTPAFNDGAVL